jgi:3-isopropylmalate/(R)-2-methylmalate dehydratase small subunit
MATADGVKKLQDAIAIDPQVTVKLDLETGQVACGDFSAPITMNEGARSMLVSGTWDACGQLVAQADQVRAIAAQLPYIQWS